MYNVEWGKEGNGMCVGFKNIFLNKKVLEVYLIYKLFFLGESIIIFKYSIFIFDGSFRKNNVLYLI